MRAGAVGADSAAAQPCDATPSRRGDAATERPQHAAQSAAAAEDLRCRELPVIGQVLDVAAGLVPEPRGRTADGRLACCTATWHVVCCTAGPQRVADTHAVPEPRQHSNGCRTAVRLTGWCTVVPRASNRTRLAAEQRRCGGRNTRSAEAAHMPSSPQNSYGYESAAWSSHTHELPAKMRYIVGVLLSYGRPPLKRSDPPTRRAVLQRVAWVCNILHESTRATKMGRGVRPPRDRLALFVLLPRLPRALMDSAL